MRSAPLSSGLVVAGVICIAGLTACGGDDGPDCDCAAAGCFADMTPDPLFVRDKAIPADIGGAAAADSLCAQQARAAMLPGVYSAWLSDASSSPYQRFSKSTVPYVLADGTMLADDWDALTREGPAAVIDVNAKGQKVAAEDGAIVWTGTGVDGRADDYNGASNFCSGWSRNVLEDSTLVGYLTRRTKSSDWSRVVPTVSCTGAGFLYCVQQ